MLHCYTLSMQEYYHIGTVSSADGDTGFGLTVSEII